MKKATKAKLKTKVKAKVKATEKTKKSNAQLIIGALLSGKTLKSRDISDMVLEDTGRLIKVQDVASMLSRISKVRNCELGHFIERKQVGNGFVYNMVKEALKLSEDQAYDLTLKTGKGRYTLDDALKDFPGLSKYAKAPKSKAKSKAKPAPKKATKPAAKKATKPAPKKAAKPAAKKTVKPAVKKAAKPAPKKAVKPAVKTVPSKAKKAPVPAKEAEPPAPEAALEGHTDKELDKLASIVAQKIAEMNFKISLG